MDGNNYKIIHKIEYYIDYLKSLEQTSSAKSNQKLRKYITYLIVKVM